MMIGSSYETRRQELHTYFDSVAADAWAALTSTDKVSRIRATVRAGRAQMRALITSWLDTNLHQRQILDAGCGTGLLSVDLARRGASVTAIDLSPRMVDIAQDRMPDDLPQGAIRWIAGDMLQPLGHQVDHSIAKDSLIHYDLKDKVTAVARLAGETRRSIIFTFAPSSPLLRIKHSVGKLFPRSDRAPAIVPVSEDQLIAALATDPVLQHWTLRRTERVSCGFYTSQAVELIYDP